jgi:flagellar basal body P-ring formation protein FlgA
MRHTASILLILFVLAGMAAAKDEDTVTLKAEAAVSGEHLLLGDIASVAGPHAGELARLPLMRSPGTGVTLSATFVAAKINEKLPGSAVCMTGAPRVTVSTSQAKISGAELEALFRDAVAKGSPFKDLGTLEITDVRTPASLSVPVNSKDNLQAKFAPGEDFLGLVTATITAGDRPSETCRVYGKVRVMAQVPVTTRAVRRGAIISEGDLELRTMDLSGSPLIVRDVKECLGMLAKTTLAAGKPVLKTNISTPPLISRGDVVAIEARAADLVIMDRGIALKDGCLGDTIPVRNTGSGKQVIGTIIARSQVEVTF